MQSSLRYVLPLLLTCLIPDLAGATPITGRTVKDWLDEARVSDGKPVDSIALHTGQLNGFVTGIAETLILAQQFCPPKGITHRDLLALIEKHLEHDYANRNRPAAPRLIQILREAHPCAKPSSRKRAKEHDI